MPPLFSPGILHTLVRNFEKECSMDQCKSSASGRRLLKACAGLFLWYGIDRRTNIEDGKEKGMGTP
jgi:hypothetical protein